MIITKTPLRVTLGGGGTDLKPYYSRYGGFVLTMAVSRHVYIAVNRMFEDKIRLSYSKTEMVDSAREIHHPVVREALGLLRLEKNLEIVSIADLPSNTGLGSSGSFAVGLLHALHVFKGDSIDRRDLAEEACRIQMEILREPEGKQDPYIAAVGGIVGLEVGRNGRVAITRVPLKDDVLKELQDNLLFFYTGIKRPSSLVLEAQHNAVAKGERDTVETMHRIKEIGFRVLDALKKGDIPEFGRLQHEHWLSKRSISSTVSSSQIDMWYSKGMGAGALGGKLLGAGGGGFLMFCCSGNQTGVRKAMAREGLRELSFNLGVGGTELVPRL